MKKPIYQKLNINNILFLAMLISALFLPNNSYANTADPERFFVDENKLFGYIEGDSCGDKTCNSDEVCQKEYRGVLPIESDSDLLGQPKTTTFSCVKARAVQAPASPYRGTEGCALNSEEDVLGGIIGSKLTGGLSGLIWNITGSIGANLSPFSELDNITGRLTSNLTSNLSNGILNGEFSDVLGNLDLSDFNNFLGLGNLLDECNYNNINQLIDSRRLIAPLPVDIFNPLPLPVNVTSPTPLPVVVVDDLALYQQKELIDAPLAAKQKAQTIATISDTLRETMSREGGTLYNYFFQTLGIGISEGALNTDTGVLPKALEKYGGSATFSPQTISDLTNKWKEKQDPTKISSLPEQNFAEQCGNLEPSQIENISFKCALLALESQNDPNHLKLIIDQATSEKVASAEELNKIKILSGDGFLPTVLNETNIFTEQVTSPGSTKRALTDKVVGASIDQAIIASGTNCFEAIPNNVLNASIIPVLTQGMFNVSNPLSATTSTTSPNQFITSLQNTLLQTVAASLSCVFRQQITGLLNGVLGTVNIPGLGNNVTRAITNTVDFTVE